MGLYRVRLQGTRSYFANVDIEAENEDEACDKAEQMDRDGMCIAWVSDCPVQDVEAWDVEEMEPVEEAG